MSWDKRVGEQPDKPFSDPEERQEIRASTKIVQDREEQREVRRRFYTQIRRFVVWLTGMSAFIIGASQVPEALSKLAKLFKGGA